MPNFQDIEAQQQLLLQYRANAQILLQQIALQGGSGLADLSTLTTLSNTRAEILRCKRILRAWDVPVEDLPEDSDVFPLMGGIPVDNQLYRKKQAIVSLSNQRKRRVIVSLSCITAFVVLAVVVGIKVFGVFKETSPEHPVIAFYYPWYQSSDWSYTTMSDLPKPTYVGSDESTLIRHLQQADDAGIDALICDWHNPSDVRLDRRCRRLLQLAEERNLRVKIAIMPDQSLGSDPSLRTVDGLEHALETLRRDFMSSPSYFTFRGKAVVFWFNPSFLDVDSWKKVRARVDPDSNQFWFGGAGNFVYLDVYDALYYFDITTAQTPGEAMKSYDSLLKKYNESHNTKRPFISTVMPGFDDTRFRPQEGHRREREDGAYYRRSWETAIEYRADAVVLNSFNEFILGSHIEPSEQYGSTYLQLTTYWIQQYQQAAISNP